MNKTDLKSIITSIIAGLAVNLIWSMATAPEHVPGEPTPTTQWVLQLPAGPSEALPGPLRYGGHTSGYLGLR